MLRPSDAEQQGRTLAKFDAVFDEVQRKLAKELGDEGHDITDAHDTLTLIQNALMIDHDDWSIEDFVDALYECAPQGVKLVELYSVIVRVAHEELIRAEK